MSPLPRAPQSGSGPLPTPARLAAGAPGPACVASPEEVLRARARALARRPPSDEPGATLDAILFRLGEETYAVDLTVLREVCPLRNLSPLPWAPEFLRGLMGLRGRVLPVLDLRRLFGMPPQGLSERDQVVVLERQGAEVGLLTERVLGLHELSLDTLQTDLPTLSGPRSRYLRGVTPDLVALLHGDRLLTDPIHPIRRASAALGGGTDPGGEP